MCGGACRTSSLLWDQFPDCVSEALKSVQKTKGVAKVMQKVVSEYPSAFVSFYSEAD